MNNIININDIKKSDYIPVNDNDFNNLDKYKINTLMKLVMKDKKNRKKILDNIFIRLYKDEDIENFSNFLVKNNLYIEYLGSIVNSDNELYKMHLSLYYDNSCIKCLYKNKANLAKQIYKHGKNYELRGYTYEYLTKLSSLDCDYKTLSLIKKITIKLLKKESLDLKLYRIRELLLGNYLLQFNNELIDQNKNTRITRVLKTVDKNYNNES